MFSCYLLLCTWKQNSKKKKTYIGYTKTNNLVKRLRQHNGELTGGAKCTKGYINCYAAVVHGFETKNKAMSFEYKWKHSVSGLEQRIRFAEQHL